MKLYYAPNACSLAVHIALEEAAAEYQLVRVHFDREEQLRPEFLAINPLGRVPVLETADGSLTEVPAILGFIAASFPEARLMPGEPFEAAKMSAFNAFISSTVHVIFAHYVRPYRWAEDEASRAAIAEKAVWSYARVFDMIEEKKLIGPWVMGDQFTIADPYLYVMTRWLTRANLGVAAYPRVADHFRRMGRRPALQRALAQEELV